MSRKSTLWRACGESAESLCRASAEPVESLWRACGEPLESFWRASGEPLESLKRPRLETWAESGETLVQKTQVSTLFGVRGGLRGEGHPEPVEAAKVD